MNQYKNLVIKNEHVKNILGYIGIISLIIIENVYINPSFSLGSTFASKIGSNILSLGLLISHFLSTVILSQKPAPVLGMTIDEIKILSVDLIWAIYGGATACILFVIFSYYIN